MPVGTQTGIGMSIMDEASVLVYFQTADFSMISTSQIQMEACLNLFLDWIRTLSWRSQELGWFWSFSQSSSLY